MIGPLDSPSLAVQKTAASCCWSLLSVQELCLPYEVSAADLDEAEPQAMLLLVAYLFTALPQLLPRAALDFICKLGDQQAWLIADCYGTLQLSHAASPRL